MTYRPSLRDLEGARRLDDLDRATADPLPELTAESSAVEVRWIAREARALLTDPDQARRARFLERKAALLAYIESTTGGAP